NGVSGARSIRSTARIYPLPQFRGRRRFARPPSRSYRLGMPPARHYKVGELDVAVVSDGTFRLDGGAVFGLIPRVMWEPVIGGENIDDEHRIPLGLNCMVVRSAGEVLVVDTGFGNKLTGAV